MVKSEASNEPHLGSRLQVAHHSNEFADYEIKHEQPGISSESDVSCGTNEISSKSSPAHPPPIAPTSIRTPYLETPPGFEETQVVDSRSFSDAIPSSPSSTVLALNVSELTKSRDKGSVHSSNPQNATIPESPTVQGSGRSHAPPPPFVTQCLSPAHTESVNGVCPPHVSAFAYAVLPYFRGVQDDGFVLSPTNTTTSSVLAIAVSSSQSPSAWSTRTNVLFSPSYPRHNVPRFFEERTAIDVRLRYMSVRAALTRCSVIINMKAQEKVSFTSRTASWMEPDFPKACCVAKYVALPLAQNLSHCQLQARCWYWLGRGEFGRGDWEAAIDAFERAIQLNVLDVEEKCDLRPRDEGKDVQKWLKMARDEWILANDSVFPALGNLPRYVLSPDQAADEIRARFNPIHNQTNWVSLTRSVSGADFSDHEWEYITMPTRTEPEREQGGGISFTPSTGGRCSEDLQDAIKPRKRCPSIVEKVIDWRRGIPTNALGVGTRAVSPTDRSGYTFASPIHSPSISPAMNSKSNPPDNTSLHSQCNSTNSMSEQSAGEVARRRKLNVHSINTNAC
ncbi:uncharacterized protein BDR25DRAFT_374571 [Lindgomyces ingoldianus]|uniref:Uncharacterized protein n=1 Tax=Lindgomyces ingoldianus TaxID=673940 RepID=A0ACB6QL49_9PLEO|nr:uncharacterized protein BDR25DRAFT_374571 [Lindgomyces ingoldianus]KAF2467728.1 hypothetical protein BDR25DRAFT_374571 [Lindgomyces ingoldianus]